MQLWQDEIPLQILTEVQGDENNPRSAELLYLLEGSLTLQMSDRSVTLQAEDLRILNRGETVRWEPAKDILLVRLTLPEREIQSAARSTDIRFLCDTTQRETEHDVELRSTLRQMLDAHVMQNGGFRVQALYYQMLELLTAHFLLRGTERRSLSEQERFEDRIAQIDRYLQANYHQPISSKDLAEALYLSQGYLIRFFKKHYGCSFADYLTRLRLRHAMDMLLHSELPITHIAYENGFSNTAAFNKAFRAHYGETPTAMRRQHRAQPAEQSHDAATERLEAYLRNSGYEIDAAVSSQYFSTECSVDHSEALHPLWQTINAGAAADLLRSDIREHILLLTQEMPFRYIRFYNIFSDEMLLKPDAQSYNFSKLDAILDFLVEHGLKPHIELGQKPKRLFRTLQNAFYSEALDAAFPDPQHWACFLRQLMGHLQRRYHRSELDSWRIELWFSEALWEDPAAEAQYFRLFDITYDTIRQYSDHMEVGGCGLRMFYLDASDRISTFLHHWSNQFCRPDFISQLHFDYEEGIIRSEQYTRRSTDPGQLRQELHSIRQALQDCGMTDTKLYVTEWNLTLSDRNYINDSSFKGAYILRNMLEHYDLADALAYNTGSDRSSEHFDSTGFLHGGAGLLTKDGIVKPAGFAYIFLRWLYPHHISHSEQYLLTTDQHEAYSFVCHNQKELNHQYYLTEEDSIRREHIRSYFKDTDPLQFSLTLTGLTNGPYQIKSYQVNEQSGDTLAAWSDMGYETELSRNDITYLRRICGPRMTIQTVEVAGGKLQIQMDLEPNEIRFVRIRKLN